MFNCAPAASIRDQAACRPADPALFFAPDGEKPEAAKVREAQANGYCAGCPVRSDCLAFALAYRAVGHWGGMNDTERKNHGRRNRRAARRDEAA